MPYVRITNKDITQESAWYYALLKGYNRKVNEVTDWKDPVFIINSIGGSGIYTQDNGDFTLFRRNKSSGQVDFVNCYVTCEISQNVVFVLFQDTATDGNNFKIRVGVIQLGGNLLTDFEYGISNDANQNPANWQVSNIFDLINEGVYYFDVRKIGTTQTVGKQIISLYLNQLDVPTTGGEDGDNPMPGDNSGE